MLGVFISHLSKTEGKTRCMLSIITFHFYLSLSDENRFKIANNIYFSKKLYALLLSLAYITD